MCVQCTSCLFVLYFVITNVMCPEILVNQFTVAKLGIRAFVRIKKDSPRKRTNDRMHVVCDRK